jgi:TATA-binding protein-associated factor
MRDIDDDVRTVAATTLLPIVPRLCTLPDLPTLLNTLWTCLDSGDDLGSSVGAVMDLLGALIAQPAVIDLIEQTPNKLLLISRIYPFLRHPIISVRRSVVQVLCRFVTAPGLERSDWMHDTFFSLMFENIILDTLYDIRETSWKAFNAGLREVESRSGEVSTVTESSIEDWYALVMTPVGHALDPKAFMRIPKKRAGHDIDKPIMQGDLGLVESETVWATKIKAAGALASLKQYLQDVSIYSIISADDRMTNISYQPCSLAALMPSLCPVSLSKNGHIPLPIASVSAEQPRSFRY